MNQWLRIEEDPDATPSERYSAVIRVAVKFPNHESIGNIDTVATGKTWVEAMLAAGEWAKASGVDPLSFTATIDTADGKTYAAAQLHWKVMR